MAMEVLVEFRQFRKFLKIGSRTNVLATIQSELEKIDEKVELCSCSQFVEGKENLFRLQRWSTKFGCYVDITDANEEVVDGDRLRVTDGTCSGATALDDKPVAGSGDVKALVRKGVSIAESLKEPSKADAKALSKLFPSSRKSEKRSSSLVFDPTSECVVAPQQRKKKRSLSLSRSNKPFKISCFLIRSLARGVPCGNYRADLRRCGNEAQVQMMRNMTKERVKVTILQAFHHISNYSFLMCSQDGKLHIAENQCPNGENILQAVGGGKSSLYILENAEQSINEPSPTGVDSVQPAQPASLESPIIVSSESDGDPGVLGPKGDNFDIATSTSVPIDVVVADECIVNSSFYDQEREKRTEFCQTNLQDPTIYKHEIQRSSLYEDVLKLYSDESVVYSYPLRIAFIDEMAIDLGGVCRDMFAGFWEIAYSNLFDGSNLLTPVMHPQTDTGVLCLLGRILSHGYLVCGCLPVRVAFPTLIAMIKGPGVVVSDQIIINTFPDSLSIYEAGVINQALRRLDQPFEEQLLDKIMEILPRFGCRQVPNHRNFKEMLMQVARYEFLVKPMAAISLIHDGIPILHSPFWNRLSVEDAFRLYMTLTANPGKVVSILQSLPLNSNEERVFTYLKQFIGSMNQDDVRKFLRFTTGSSVCLTKSIRVHYNSLSGFARRPVSHTCDCSLELPSTYTTYPSFVDEFQSILSQPENAWTMDAI